jgi:hypothetical protein
VVVALAPVSRLDDAVDTGVMRDGLVTIGHVERVILRPSGPTPPAAIRVASAGVGVESALLRDHLLGEVALADERRDDVRLVGGHRRNGGGTRASPSGRPPAPR